MPSKENYCYRILKSYSLIIDFDGMPTRDNVPGPVEGETYGRWKERVLGNNVSNVVLYAPYQPAHQTKISTLQNQAGAENLEKIFRSFVKTKEKQKVSAVGTAIQSAERKFASIPKDTLTDLLAELRDANDALEPSVKECLDRFLETTASDIGTEALVRELLKSYNCAVRNYRLKL